MRRLSFLAIFVLGATSVSAQPPPAPSLVNIKVTIDGQGNLIVTGGIKNPPSINNAVKPKIEISKDNPIVWNKLTPTSYPFTLPFQPKQFQGGPQNPAPGGITIGTLVIIRVTTYDGNGLPNEITSGVVTVTQKPN